MKYLFTLLSLIIFLSVFAQQDPVNYSANLPATDALGRRLPTFEEVGPLKNNRLVGMFYWTWHYAQAESKIANNTTAFIQQFPEAINNYDHPAWPQNIINFWSEPLFGYYTSKDKWVLWKHAEMLADAGVDAIFFDCTNGDFVWKPSYMALCEVFAEARQNGIRTPKIVFMMAFGPYEFSRNAIKQVYNDLYREGLYKDLWFYWEGKPLIMAYPDNLEKIDSNPEESALNLEMKNFFTFRPGQPVYDKGPQRSDHWGWLEIYPQHGFGKNKEGNFEQMTVGVSQNWSKERGLTAMNAPGSFGRSYTNKNGQDERLDAHQYGLNFQEQWDHALMQDVELIFVTGWNEWIAGRYKEWGKQHNAFPDQYDIENSRDIEPMKGGHHDNYYYQLISNIRRFKGMPAPEKVVTAKSIRIDGQFNDWLNVLPHFKAHKGSTIHRDSPGFVGFHYQNKTGRNDIISAKVSSDDQYVYFYVKTNNKFTHHSDPKWMRLLIDIDRNKSTGWEGYDLIINRQSPGHKSLLEKWSNNQWTESGMLKYSYKENEMEICIPRKQLQSGSPKLNVEFKWSDNMQDETNIMDFYINGDAAPAGRFNYFYQEP